MFFYIILLTILSQYLLDAQYNQGVSYQTCLLQSIGGNGLGGMQTCQGACYPDILIGFLIRSIEHRIGQGSCPINTKCVCSVTDVNPVNPVNPVISGQCGIKGSGGSGGSALPIVPRIIGGTDSYSNEWCWQAAIMTYNNFLAGGALINNQWVVTSAYRVYNARNNPQALQVQLGGQTLNNNNLGGNYFGSSLTKNVIRVIIHEQFNPNGPFYENNLALLQLDSPVDLSGTGSQGACAICLPNIYGLNNQYNKQCTVTGYGSATIPGGAHSQTLKVINVPLVDDNQCLYSLKTYAQNKNVYIHPGFICAGGYVNQDACTGDGGTPLACENNGVYELAGIANWGLGCGQRIPAVYTKISYYLNWINARIGLGVNPYQQSRD